MPVNLDLPLGRNFLRNAVDSIKPHIQNVQTEHGIIIVDTIRPAFLSGMDAGSENDSTSMMKVFPPLKTLARETGWAVLAVHHNNKTHDDYAGSAAIAGQVDSFWSIRRPIDSSVSSVNFHTRHGYQSMISVARDADGMLYRLDTDDDVALSSFICQFPTEEAKAISKDEVSTRFKDLARGTISNRLSEATKRTEFPKLVRTGSYHDPRYYRLSR